MRNDTIKIYLVLHIEAFIGDASLKVPPVKRN